MKDFSSYDYVFSVLGGEVIDDTFEIKNIYGTAFYINNNFFITCAHSVINATQEQMMVLGYQDENGELKCVVPVNHEIFEQNDSAIIQASIERAKAFKWNTNKAPMLTEVYSTGFAYGFDIERKEVLIRSYKGTISMVGFYHKFPSSPPHYELSYMCPRGISGAPLLVNIKNQPYVIGFTIGNIRTSMIVWSNKETNVEDDITSEYTLEEALHRGIALQAQSFLDIESQLLDMPIGEYLILEDLV